MKTSTEKTFYNNTKKLIMAEPVFVAKPDMDPFYLYGSQDMTVSDLQETRLKLAVLRAQDQLEDQKEAIDTVDNDLRELIALESGAGGADIKEPKVVVKKVIKKDKMDDNNIRASLKQIQDTFSVVFQTLIGILESSLVTTNSPLEQDRISKRSREFECRLARSVFEAKQKLLVLQASTLKYGLHPDNASLEYDAKKKLYTVLRCLSLLLQSYQHHLPLSGGHIEIPSITKAIEIFNQTACLVNEMGFKPESAALSQDSGRLKNALMAFKAKKAKDTTIKEPLKDKQATKKGGQKLDLKLFQNLARQKFGSPDLSPKKSNISRASSLIMNKGSVKPKANKVLEDRAAYNRARFFSSDSKRSDFMPSGNPSKLMDEETTIASSTMEDDHISNNDVLVPSSKKGPEKNSFLPSSSKKGPEKNVVPFELDDVHLRNILKSRASEEDYLMIDQLSHMMMMMPSDPVAIIAKISEKVVDNVVKNVCREAIPQDLLKQIIYSEMAG